MPEAPLLLTNWNTLNPKNEHRSGKTHSSNFSSPVPTQIVEATGWAISPKGEVILTAQAPNITPNSFGLKPAVCHEP